VKARAVAGLDPAAPLRPNAERIMRTRLDEMLALAPAALDPTASAAQHDLRIAAKRVRYVLEIFGPCFGSEAKTARDAAKRLQGVLGEIHDCDEMLARAEGIESLCELLRTRRELLFREFTELWRKASLDGHTFSLLSGESGGDLKE
jgi:CHAD domain-containing protein